MPASPGGGAARLCLGCGCGCGFSAAAHPLGTSPTSGEEARPACTLMDEAL